MGFKYRAPVRGDTNIHQYLKHKFHKIFLLHAVHYSIFFLFYSILFKKKIAPMWDTSQSLRNMRQTAFQVPPTSEIWGCWKPP